MGNLATPEALPYKIELNAWGKVEMSPAGNRHSGLQGELAAEVWLVPEKP